MQNRITIAKQYLSMTKPGIIRGNVLSGIGGFLLAANGTIAFTNLLAFIAGTSCIIASACILNNIIDRQIDAKMQRTSKRVLATGEVSVIGAAIFSAALVILGITLLIVWTNWKTVLAGMVGFFGYVVAYAIFKRRSAYGTLIGGIPGAMPLVAGYTAASGRYDSGALLLFIIMMCWQMPHFLAIALYRQQDYKAANLPVWPIAKGVDSTKRQIIYYMVAFFVGSLLLRYYEYASNTFVVCITAISAVWIWRAFSNYRSAQVTAWAKGVFGYSLITLLVFSVLLSINFLLP